VRGCRKLGNEYLGSLNYRNILVQPRNCELFEKDVVPCN
jgi:hypothetical protein